MRRTIPKHIRDSFYSLAEWEFDHLTGPTLSGDDPRGEAMLLRDLMFLLDDIGWHKEDDREEFELTMSDAALERLCLSIVSRAEQYLSSCSHDPPGVGVRSEPGLVTDEWCKPSRWLTAAAVVLMLGGPDDQDCRERDLERERQTTTVEA